MGFPSGVQPNVGEKAHGVGQGGFQGQPALAPRRHRGAVRRFEDGYAVAAGTEAGFVELAALTGPHPGGSHVGVHPPADRQEERAHGAHAGIQERYPEAVVEPGAADQSTDELEGGGHGSVASNASGYPSLSSRNVYRRSSSSNVARTIR